MADSTTERFALIGDPIAKSLSPALFRAAYNGRFPYDLIEGSDFEASWKRFLDGYKAINVTAPFKEKAFAKVVGLMSGDSPAAAASSVSGPCAKTGAVNIVIRDGDALHAHNSDFTGIIMSVADALFPGIVREFLRVFGPQAHIKVHQYVREALPGLYRNQPQALIVGCGGAGKAAAVAAAEMGFATSLMNRTFRKAEELGKALPEYNFLPVPARGFRDAFRECDLVIWTLPCEWESDGVGAAASLTEEDFITEGNEGASKIVLEANYKSPVFSGETAGRMESAGCQYVSGKKWLLYQGVSGYSLMTGEAPDLEAMLDRNLWK